MTSYTFSQLIDFTRTTSGTYTNSSGFITSTPASVNLLTYTQEFDNAGWTKNNATVTANAVAAPDGTLTADTLLAQAGSGIMPRFAQGVTVVASTLYTASYFVRPGTHTFVQVYVSNQTSDWCNFTLTGNGSVQNNGGAVGAISYNAATGWYRISMTWTAAGTDRFPWIGLVPNASAAWRGTGTYAGTETIFIWGAQLEQASSATDYTRNYGGLFPPRFDYDPVTLQPRGILIEEQRTNLLTYSEQFDDVAWSKSGMTVGADTALGPDGTYNADSFVEDTTTGGHLILRAVATVPDNTLLTASWYVKAATRSWCALTIVDKANVTNRVWYDVSTGTQGTTNGTVTSFSATNVGNGWYRLILTASSSTGATVPQIRISSGSADNTPSYTGTGATSLYLWGAQLEVGAFATSYIPTVASQVTRTADTATIQAPMFAPWFNNSEGTFVADYDVVSTAATAKAVITTNDGTSNNINIIYVNNVALAVCEIRSGGVSQATFFPSSVSANTPLKTAVAYRTNDFAASSAGGAATTDNSGTVAANQMELNIGHSRNYGGLQLCGHLRSLRYYPTRLTNAQLQALTA